MGRAVGLCLVGAALGFYGAVGVARGDPAAQADTAPVYEYPGQQGYDAEPAPAAPDEAETSADTWDYQRPCDQPESPEQRDLCQQCRMAKASEDLVSWASWQFWVTAGEICLLIATVAFTGWAAWGAGYAARQTGRAADAAIEANKISRDIGIRQLRAYVNLSTATIHNFSLGQVPIVRLQARNTGQTPAFSLRMKTRMIIGPEIDKMLFSFKTLDATDESVATISANLQVNTEIPFRYALMDDDIETILTGGVWVAVGILITYFDIFKKRRRTVIKLVLWADDSLREGNGVFRPYRKGNRST